MHAHDGLLTDSRHVEGVFSSEALETVTSVEGRTRVVCARLKISHTVLANNYTHVRRSVASSQLLFTAAREIASSQLQC